MAERQIEMGQSAARNPASTEAQQSSTSQSSTSNLSRGTAHSQGLATHARSPFAVMRRMMEDMDRMFEDFGFGGGLSTLFRNGGVGRDLHAFGSQLWSPQIEVQQREGQLVVKADLPGLKENDVQIEVHDGALVLRGERRQEQQSERDGINYSERSYGTFTRSIPIPHGVRAEDVEASFDNGVLQVSLRVPEQQGSRRVHIKSGTSAQSTSSGGGTGQGGGNVGSA